MAVEDLQRVLGSSSFRRLFGVRLTGQFSDGLVQAALTTFVLFSPEREASAPRIAIAFVILLLPYSLIGPFVGVVLDRWRRREVLVTLGIGRFVLSALAASLPHTVDADTLVTANALSPTAGTVASIMGGLVGVGIRALGGGGDRGSMIVLGCAAAMYLVSSMIARTIAIDLLGPHGDIVGEGIRDVLRGLREGFSHLRQHRAAANAIIVVSFHRVAFGAATVLAILLLRNTLNPPSDPAAALAGLTLVLIAAGLGAFIGAVLTPRMSRHLGSVPWSALVLLAGAVLALVGFLGTTLGWPLTTGMAGLLLASLGIGFAGQAVKVTSDTVVQRAVSDDHRGRVFSLYDVSVNVGMVVGVLWIAFAAPVSGLSPSIDVLIALVLTLAAGWYVIVSRRLGPIA